MSPTARPPAYRRARAGLDAAAAVVEPEREAARVGSPDLAHGAPGTELPMGLSGAYRLDLRGHDQVATLVALDVPALLLQGGRDYRARSPTTSAAGARASPAARGSPSASTRVDHFFFAGEGPSTPADYARGARRRRRGR
ncbi:hypothetical protein [Streptacidiphilus neutrinimicus]|uniref:hypothetical protein n=1 Tax=Streptacidiphilus neutrinimicus TaxID=105420 RepID=UPI0006941D20|nr:hypothetical protein [Streptacidiphilus neutrinimicus]